MLRAGPAASSASNDVSGFPDCTFISLGDYVVVRYEYLCWSLIFQSLVRPLGIVEAKILTYADPGISSSCVCFQVHLLVLQAAPQPFNE